MSSTQPSPASSGENAPASRETRLAELVTTRICHDLAGLTSAFSNGAEIIGQHLDGDKALISSSVELLAMSAEDARARVVLFRKLFGSDQNDIEHPEAVIDMMRDYLRGFTVNAGNAPGSAQAAEAKMMLAFAMICHKAFPAKAALTVAFDGEGFTCAAEGKMLALDMRERETLERPQADAEPVYENLAAWRLRDLASQCGAAVKTDIGEKTLSVRIEHPPA